MMKGIISVGAFFSAFFFPIPLTLALGALAAFFFPPSALALGLLLDGISYTDGLPLGTLVGALAMLLAFFVRRFVMTRMMFPHA